MNRVLSYRTPKIFSQRSFISLRRVGSPHQIAPGLYRVFFVQHHNHAGSARHEFSQATKEWPLAMDRVEAFRFSQAHVQRFHRPKLETSVVDALNDVAAITRANGVGLDDSECKVPHLWLVIPFRDSLWLCA